MTPERRVLYVISGFPRGGAEAGLLHLVRRGVFEGCDFRIAGMVAGEMLDDFQRRGLTPIVFSSRPRMGLIEALGAVPKLATLIRRMRPDILILSLPQANIIGRIVGRVLRVPVIVAFEHNGELSRSIYSRLYRLTSRCVDVVFADCAETLREVLQRHYGSPQPGRCEIVPLVALSKPLDLAPPRPLTELVSVGRLTAVKNHEAAIRAVALLRDAGEFVRLTILGEGALRTELMALIQALELDDRIAMPGFRPAWWREHAFDAVLLPSRHEGLCISAVEAMWAGIPVVAPLIGGLRDYADETSMFVLDDVSPQTIAAGLRRAGDAQLRQQIAKRAQARVIGVYGDETVNRVYARLNQELRRGFAPAASVPLRASA